MANFDKTNWYYLFIVYPPNPVKWSQAHSTGPHPIQLVPKFQYWLIQCQNSQFWQNKVILSFLAKSVLTKERQDQLKKLNSNVRGSCKGLCTHARTQFECTGPCIAPWHWNSIFSTFLVFSLLGQTMPIEKRTLEIFLCVHAKKHVSGGGHLVL